MQRHTFLFPFSQRGSSEIWALIFLKFMVAILIIMPQRIHSDTLLSGCYSSLSLISKACQLAIKVIVQKYITKKYFKFSFVTHLVFVT